MDLLSVSIGIGLAVTLFLSEFFGIAAAGLVVPGYLALHLTDPLKIVLTLTAGLATFGLVRGMSSLVIIFGRRRTVLMILVGYLMGMLVRYVSGAAVPGETGDYMVIGFIIPGLIATWLDRRGIVESLSSLLIASVLVRLILILVFGAGVLS